MNETMTRRDAYEGGGLRVEASRPGMLDSELRQACPPYTYTVNDMELKTTVLSPFPEP